MKEKWLLAITALVATIFTVAFFLSCTSESNAEEAAVSVGEIVPNFALQTSSGDTFKLSDHKGQMLLISSNPKSKTKVCSKQMEDLEAVYDQLKEHGVTAYGFNVDSVETVKSWVRELHLKKVVLLSDSNPKGEVAKKLGIYAKLLRVTDRANLLIDGEGRLVWKKVYKMTEQPDFSEVIKEVNKLTGKTD